MDRSLVHTVYAAILAAETPKRPLFCTLETRQTTANRGSDAVRACLPLLGVSIRRRLRFTNRPPGGAEDHAAQNMGDFNPTVDEPLKIRICLSACVKTW
jgi:hypothetical protein